MGILKQGTGDESKGKTMAIKHFKAKMDPENQSDQFFVLFVWEEVYESISYFK